VNSKRVSVILPTFNEAPNIVQLVRAVVENIPPEWEYEVLVVDDNSPDGTYEIVRGAFIDDPRIITILRTTDRGLGKSIWAGLEKATGDQVVVMDSDFTHDPIEIPRLLHVGEVYDIVSGSRFCAGGRMVDFAHYLSSMVYNWGLRLLVHTQVQDNLGGYFTAWREKLLKLPLDEIFFGYGDYYFRLLHFAQVAGMSIVEIPAEYLPRVRGKSKSNLVRMFFTYTFGAIKLKRRVRNFRRLDQTKIPRAVNLP